MDSIGHPDRVDVKLIGNCAGNLLVNESIVVGTGINKDVYK